MSDETFYAPCIGYGTVNGNHKVALVISSGSVLHISPELAEHLGTDLLIWAKRVREFIEYEEEDE